MKDTNIQNTWLFPRGTLNGTHNVRNSRYHPRDTEPLILHPQGKREIKPKLKFIGAESDETWRQYGRFGKGRSMGKIKSSRLRTPLY
jgi:hypothetical protein